MESTIEKLNNNRLMELNDQDYENISNNTELKTLFITKIKEGYDFTVSDASEILGEFINDKDIFKIVLLQTKREYPEEFIRFHLVNPQEFEEEFSPEIVEVIKEFLADTFDEFIKLLHSSEEISLAITNEKIINIIIENKLEKLYGCIKLEKPTPEIEKLIIGGIHNNTYKTIYTITRAIIKACQETNQLSAIAKQIDPENEEYSTIILEALEEGIIQYVDLDYNFTKKYSSDIRIIREQIRRPGIIYISNEDAEREEVQNLIIKEIKRDPNLLENWSIKNICEEYTKLLIVAVRLWKTENTINMFRYGKLEKLEFTPEQRSELIDAIIYSLNKDLGLVTEFFDRLIEEKRYYPETITPLVEDHKLYDFLIPKIPIEHTIHHFLTYHYEGYTQERYSLSEADYKLLESYNLIMHEVPKNFHYEVDYPTNVWLAVLQVIKPDQLIEENIKLDRFIQYPDILDAIFKKLKEFKSNKYNRSIEYWTGPFTKTMIEIICDPENPLNLSATQRLKILPSAKLQNSKHMLQILHQMEKTDYTTLEIIFPQLKIMEDLSAIKQIAKLLYEKLELGDNEIEYLSRFSADIGSTLINKPKGIDEWFSKQSIALYDTLNDFLKTQTNIPLRLTRYFPAKTREIATYSNLEALATTPDFFLIRGERPQDFTDFVEQSMKKNLPINLKILHASATDSASDKFYEYNNITFDSDTNTYEILYELLNETKKVNENENPKRKIISKWVKECLTYKFFDCQIQGYTNKLLQLLITTDEYIDVILDRICADKINDNTVLNYRILNMLIDYENKEQVKKVIYELIKQNKIDNLQVDLYTIPLLKIEDKIVIDYIKETLLKKIDNNRNIIEALLSNDNYKEATLEELKKLFDCAITPPVIDLISKFPELKEIAIHVLENNISTWLNFRSQYFDKDLLKAYLKKHSTKNVITYIVHSNDVSNIPYESYEIIKVALLEENPEYIKETYDVLEEFFGKKILLLLETDNFIALLKQTPDIAKKFFEVFKKRELDLQTIISINDSFQQKIFSIENIDVINFFTNTIEKIQRGITDEETQDVVKTIIQYIPNNLEEEIQKTNNELLLNAYKTNHYEFILLLLQALSQNQDIYISLFNKITHNLIIQKRNEHRSKQDVYKDTKLTYELDTKSLFNALFNYLAKNDSEELISILLSTDHIDELNLKTIYFLSGQQDKYSPEEVLKIKKNIPHVKEIIINEFKKMNIEDEENYENSWWMYDSDIKEFNNLPRKYEYLLNIPEFMKLIKKIPKYPKKEEEPDIISKINIPVFAQLAQDKDKYKALLELLEKYKFLEWGDLFQPSIEKITIGENEFDIYNFINAFNKIYENEKRIILRERKRLIEIVVEEMRNSGKAEDEIKDYIRVKENEPINIQITPYKILKYSTIYSSIANYYKIILGMEDFELVKRNDPDNAAHANQIDRLERTSRMQIKMMQLDEVTIPSFISEPVVSKTDEPAKKIQVIVANRADSRNLTHGERTGACMRAYGFANDLFTFCNTDPRGFHITFVDPETNEYISRVSGFRNGNTVFLNQLRESVHRKYSTEDVVIACKQIAQELIEKSKDSSMPIENVVASSGYALRGHEQQQLSEHNIGKGVYEGYKDVTSYAVVLATTGENGKAVPLKLDGENQPIYKPVRLKPREYISPNITEATKIQLQRITSIKECIANKEIPDYYKTIDFDYELIDTEYLHVIIGQDWFVALDVHGNLTHDIAIQNEQSINELNEAIAKMNAIKETKSKTGGFINEI